MNNLAELVRFAQYPEIQYPKLMLSYKKRQL